MDFTKATNDQLEIIFQYESDCSPSLLEGVAIEMITRRLLDGIILFSAKKVFRNVPYVLTYRLKMDSDELIHIGNIEILKRLSGFIHGTRTVKTYLIMCLTSKFSKMIPLVFFTTP
jgi:hypothetical protein